MGAETTIGGSIDSIGLEATTLGVLTLAQPDKMRTPNKLMRDRLFLRICNPSLLERGSRDFTCIMLDLS
jgi:hypothetical protein